MIQPVILCGGSGTRLWPVSRSGHPKQLHALVGDMTLLQQTASRARGDGFLPPLVVTNAQHARATREQLAEAGAGGDADAASAAVMLIEPVARNTAPAIIAAASLVMRRQGPTTLLLVMPADHVIGDTAAFRAAVSRAVPAAGQGALVTFGVQPDRPETGYGYIGRGAGRAGLDGCYEVARFVEKPDAEQAERLLRDGSYSWNSGIFLFTAEALLGEARRLRPELTGRVEEAVARGAVEEDGRTVLLDPRHFARCDAISIDYAIMEKTDRAVVVPVDMAWSDVGSWSALWDIGPQDAEGNVRVGNVIAEGARNSYIHSTSRLVAVVGVEDLVIIETSDAVMVAPRHRVQDVKIIAAQLSAEGRPEA